jgi:hypothetical protein
MLTFHPLSIVMHGLALNITIQTYAGNVDFGIIADRKAMPHAQDLADALEAAFAEAQKLYSASQPAAPGVAKETQTKAPSPKTVKAPAARKRNAATVSSGRTTTRKTTTNANGNAKTSPKRRPAASPSRPSRA